MPRQAAPAVVVPALLLALIGGSQTAAGQGRDAHPVPALSAGQTAPARSLAELTPEERMQRRWPQPVRVGDLIGLPVLDFQDRTLGYVQSVVRTAAGKIRLIVPYGGFLGWGRRPVAVPIEVLGIAGRQLAALDMTRAEFDAAPAWNDPASRPLPAGDIIRIGLYRR